MGANEGRKKDEVKKCLFILNRLRLHIAGLEALGLSASEKSILQGAYSQMDLVKAGLDELSLEREAKKRSRKCARL